MAIIITVLGSGKRATIDLLLRGDEFSVFFYDTFVSITAIIVFQSTGISLFIASSVRINCLSYFYRGASLESPSHENLSPKISENRHFSMCENKNTISSASASATAINYRAPRIIRRKPPRVLIKLVIHPLDFRRFKTAVPNWHGPGP